nr:uncharacterized protein LOC119715614 [Anas platyrhynchos]
MSRSNSIPDVPRLTAITSLSRVSPRSRYQSINLRVSPRSLSINLHILPRFFPASHRDFCVRVGAWSFSMSLRCFGFCQVSPCLSGLSMSLTRLSGLSMPLKSLCVSKRLTGLLRVSEVSQLLSASVRSLSLFGHHVLQEERLKTRQTQVASMCACVYFPRMCSLCGRKTLNKEVLKNSEFLRTPADWTPLMQFVVHQDFFCVGFLDAVRRNKIKDGDS